MHLKSPSPQDLRAALRGLIDPASGRDLSELPPQALRIEGDTVHLVLAVPRAQAAAMQGVGQAAEQRLRAVPGVGHVAIVLTTHREAGPPAIASGRGEAASGPTKLPGIEAVIAVASGKGGVGKSTTAVNLAVAMAAQGLRIGLLDADIHGPSLPRMLGVERKPDLQDGMMIPLDAWGIRAMSIGFMVDENAAMVWRGPMVMGALRQMLDQVAWGELDCLVVDMPPGTGDAQLTLCQRVALTGAVIVSTPQDIALLDARRGVQMFRKVDVPILGVVENMSWFCCPHCAGRTDIFGHGGARMEAERLGVPFLGDVPLLPAIRGSGDAGRPIAAAKPGGAPGMAYAELARRLIGSLPQIAATRR